MIYELLDVGSLAGALPASLLLAADRALLSTRLSRATDVPARPAMDRAHRLAPERLKRSAKIALVARGINRRTPVVEAVSRLGIRGFLGVARDVLAPPRVKHTPPRRAAYLAEYGDMPAGFDDVPSESLSIETAAMLSGIYGFLSDIPALARRRQDVQRRRGVTDGDIVRRFGSHWRQQCPARFQREHDELQLALIDELDLDAIGQGDRTDAATKGAWTG
jgi:hypothetical protein